jgi:hypothetical protein
MNKIYIKPVISDDIPIWIALSHQYDAYASELVPDLSVWYEGDENSMAFTDYMIAKIKKNEVFMAIDEQSDICLGITAFSKTNNRITFFAVSHEVEFNNVGNMLIKHVLSRLDSTREVTVNILKSNAPHIIKEKELFGSFGFSIIGSQLENGVPVYIMSKT